MEKMNVILVVLNNKYLEQSIATLNFNKVNLVSVIVESSQNQFLLMGDKEIPIATFSMMQRLLDGGKKFFWLISGFVDNFNDLYKVKNFLMDNGIPEENIINFELLSGVNTDFIANLRYIEKNGADFFATGNEYTEIGLNLTAIPHVRGKGVNLASTNQDLRQGYLTAKHVFEHVAPGTIKFVLIGLSPDSFHYDASEVFSARSSNLQYMLSLKNYGQGNFHDFLLKNFAGNSVKKLLGAITEQQADLNLERAKRRINAEFSAKALINWEDALADLKEKLRPQVMQKNFQILKDYIKLCNKKGAKPIGVVLPFAPTMIKNYDANLLEIFQLMIHELEERYDFECINLFNSNLEYDSFYDMTHLNTKGALFSSAFIGLRLYEKNLLPIENFLEMNYAYFSHLAQTMPKDEYNALIEKIFDISVKRIRRKDKIKVGFVMYDSSMWCGDDLYNFFAKNERFEPTVFLCIRVDRQVNEINRDLFEKNLQHGVKQFKNHNLNVVALDDREAVVPVQDVLISLTPYLSWLPNAFHIERLTPKTLISHIPYAFDTATRRVMCGEEPIFSILWRLFAPSSFLLEMYKEYCPTGLPNGFYSGYPKMDIFFNKYNDFLFDWKMTSPNAKKIIYAPHWSINEGVRYSTFQWNYQFMYEFAKAHPEISWVVKPHQNLMYSAVKSGLFPSIEAFKKYLQDWDDLPNAQVYTGAYYQDIFATSDGMIHDCGSFIAEYQYMDKPMIFLFRGTQSLNDLGKEILKVSYLVDGKDFDGIAATIQKVFIEGNDDKATERKELFDKYLNYPKANGMSASEFIYKSIADEFKTE